MDADTRRFAAIVVVVMVMLAGLLAALSSQLGVPGWPGDDDGDDLPPDDEGWEWYRDTVAITGDVVWEDREVLLDHPVIVTRDASLRLVDTLVEVPLEIAIGLTAPVFQVEDLARLELVNSDIVVRADGRLDRALMNLAYNNYYNLMWRVVNLKDAERPVLEFEVELVHGSTIVVVAVQEAPGHALVPLDVVRPESVPRLEWTRVTVPLYDYAGTAPRLYIVLHNITDRDVLLSDVRVTDGGEPLEGDLPFTGDPLEDGWYVDGFEAFYGQVQRSSTERWQLVRSAGELVADGSSFQGVGGLYNGDREYWPLRTIPYPSDPPTIRTAARVFGINATDGLLTLRGSEVSHTPVSVLDSQLVVENCTFEGDNEMLTVHDCSGTIEGSSFEHVGSGADRGRSSRDGLDWQLAVGGEGEDGRVWLVGCDFIGGGVGVGLHTSGANVGVEDCYFSGFQVAIWSHDVQPTSWEELEGALTFDGTNTICYLGTSEVRVVLMGEGRPPSSYINDYSRVQLPYLELPDLPIELWAHKTPLMVTLCAPTVVVDGSGRVDEVENLTTRIYPNWPVEGFVDTTVTFDPREGMVTKVYEISHEQTTHRYGTVSVWHREGNGTGVVEQQITVDARDLGLSSVLVDFLLDGELVETIDLVEEGVDWNASVVRLYRNRSIPLGEHQVLFRVRGERAVPPYVILVAERRCVYHRLAKGTHQVPVGDLLSSDLVVLLERGAIAWVGGYSNKSEDQYAEAHIELVLAEGATASVGDLDLGGYVDLWVSATGSGRLNVDNVSAYQLVLMVNGTDLTVGSVSASSYYIINYLCGVVQTAEVSALWFAMYPTDGNLTLQDATVVWGYETVLYCTRANVTMVDSSFRGREEPLTLFARQGSNVAVQGCVFESMALMLGPVDPDCTVSVTGNRFAGEDAFLALVGDFAWSAEGERVYVPPSAAPGGTVSGNVFGSASTDLLFDPAFLPLLESGDIQADASALAIYGVNLTFSPAPPVHADLSIITPSSWRALGDDRYRFYYEPWLFYMMLDVTDDLGRAIEPGLVPVVITGGSYYGPGEEKVVGFAEVDPTSGEVTLPVPAWDNDYWPVREMLDDVPRTDTWWTDG